MDSMEENNNCYPIKETVQRGGSVHYTPLHLYCLQQVMNFEILKFIIEPPALS